MSLDPVLNFSVVEVSTGYDDSATSIVLANGEGSKLPDPAVGGEYNLVWWDYSTYKNPADDPNVEIVRVTVLDTDSSDDTTLTIERNQESSGASTKNTADKTYKMVLSLTKLNYDAIKTHIDTNTQEKTFTISPSGGDYSTIQAALTANATADTLFLVYPGTYVDDTINFTASNQSVVGVGLTPKQVITNTAQIIDYGAFTGCRMSNIRLEGTYTSAIDMITGSGELIARDVGLVLNVTGTIAGSPHVVNTTGSFKQVRGTLKYNNAAISSGQIKSALMLGTAATVELRRVIVDIDGSNASSAITLGYGSGTGVLNAYRCNVDILDTDAVIVNGLAYLGGSGDHEYFSNDLHVECGGDGKFAYGFLCTTATTLTIRGMFNHLHIEDGGGTGKSYGMSIGTDCTVVSQFDDIIAADGIINNGTFTGVNSDADGDLTVTGNVDGRDLSVDGAKLDGIEALADVTGSNAPQAHKTSHENGGGDEVDVVGLSGLLADDQHVLDAEVQAVSINNVSEDATPELGGELDCGANSIGFTQQAFTATDATTTIDWKLGNKYEFTFDDENQTFTFTAPSNPCNILLVLIQDATGSRTVTWPGTVKWPASTAPTLTTTASAIDVVSFYYDGTSYYGQSALAFGVPA